MKKGDKTWHKHQSKEDLEVKKAKRRIQKVKKQVKLLLKQKKQRNNNVE